MPHSFPTRRSSDLAVADDAELLAADLEGVGRRLDPAAAMAGGVLLRNAAQEQDGFGQYQFGHRTGIGVGRVEYRDTALAGGVQVDLVGRSEEHTSELQSLMRISYAVFCLKK